MAVEPNPRYLKLVCCKCGWSRVITQLSDALLVPDVCNQCGADDLQAEPISEIEYLFRISFQKIRLFS